MTPDALAWALRRYVPDPFSVALALTLLSFGLAWAVGEVGFLELVDAWAAGAAGFWSYLGFAMQMCLILVTGFVVAATPPVGAAIERLARRPRSTRQAVVLISLCAMGASLVSWGVGLVVGALLAREVGQGMASRGIPVHHPVLGAAGYTGMCTWHGGLSGSAPLKVTQTRDLVEVLGPELAAIVGPIPLTRTVLDPSNLLVTGLLLVVVPAVLVALVPRDPGRFVAPPPRPPPAPSTAAPDGPAALLDRGPWLVVPVVALMGIRVAVWLGDGGLLRMGPNELNFAFLMIGLALIGSPARYMAVATEAAAATAGIIVQFPLYAGIRGLLVAGGLVTWLGRNLPEGEAGLVLVTWLGAGLLNLFVPSGGGQWGVQGPLVVSAAVEAGVDPARVVMALAYGDQWTNLFQPFWALPLLGITGNRAGDILGYTAILGVAVGAVFAVGLLVG